MMRASWPSPTKSWSSRSSPSRRPWRRSRACCRASRSGSCSASSLVGGAAAAGLYAWDRSYEGRVLPGVSAAGLDLTGLDRAQATAALDKAYDAVTTGRVVIQTEAGDVVRALCAVRPPRRHRGDGRRRAPRRARRHDRRTGAGRDPPRPRRRRRSSRPSCSIPTRSRPASTRRCPGSIVAPVDAQIVKGTDGTYTVPAQTGRAFNGTAAAVGRADGRRQARRPR